MSSLQSCRGLGGHSGLYLVLQAVEVSDRIEKLGAVLKRGPVNMGIEAVAFY